jgi:hypothetical protein
MSVPFGTSEQGSFGEARFIVHGQDQHRHLFVILMNITHQTDFIPPFERDVHDDHVGAEPMGLFLGSVCISRFSTDGRILFLVQELAQSHPKDLMILHDHDPGFDRPGQTSLPSSQHPSRLL